MVGFLYIASLSRMNSDFHLSLFRRKYNFSSVFHKAYLIDVAAIYLVSTAAHRCPQRQRAVRDKIMFFEQHMSSTDLQSLQQLIFAVVEDLLIFLGDC